MLKKFSLDEFRERVTALVASQEDTTFIDLVRIAGLDPARDLKHCRLVNQDMTGCDLSGFDFSGAILAGARFDGALISKTRFLGAQVSIDQLRRAKDASPKLLSRLLDDVIDTPALHVQERERSALSLPPRIFFLDERAPRRVRGGEEAPVRARGGFAQKSLPQEMQYYLAFSQYGLTGASMTPASVPQVRLTDRLNALANDRAAYLLAEKIDDRLWEQVSQHSGRYFFVHLKERTRDTLRFSRHTLHSLCQSSLAAPDLPARRDWSDLVDQQPMSLFTILRLDAVLRHMSQEHSDSALVGSLHETALKEGLPAGSIVPSVWVFDRESFERARSLVGNPSFKDIESKLSGQTSRVRFAALLRDLDRGAVHSKSTPVYRVTYAFAIRLSKALSAFDTDMNAEEICRVFEPNSRPLKGKAKGVVLNIVEGNLLRDDPN